SAFQVGRSAAEVSLKRYRYTGKERDYETGFSYHGARYYAPWLGRWASKDPIGSRDGLNLYSYGHDNPVIGVDLTAKTVTIKANDARESTSKVIVTTTQEQANEAFLRDIRAGLTESEAKLFSIDKQNNLVFSGKDTSKLSELGQMLVKQVKSDRRI